MRFPPTVNVGAWLLLVLVWFGAAGCASTESDNMAERPWNAPRSWEHGLPPSIMEGR